MRAQSSAAMRSPIDALVLRGVGADELPDFVDRLLPLFEHRRENLEDVNHVFPRLERDLHAGLARALGQPRRVVEQSLRGADLDQYRRQARELGRPMVTAGFSGSIVRGGMLRECVRRSALER